MNISPLLLILPDANNRNLRRQGSQISPKLNSSKANLIATEVEELTGIELNNKMDKIKRSIKKQTNH